MTITETIQSLRKIYQAAFLPGSGASQAQKEQATDVLNFLILSEAALLYSSAAALVGNPPLSQCDVCGNPVVKIKTGTTGCKLGDAGNNLAVLSPDGSVHTGGLYRVLVKDEAFLHVGWPLHVCGKQLEGPKT